MAEGAVTPIVVGKDWKESLEVIKNKLEEEDFKSVIANCSEYYNSEDVPGSVQTTLMHIYLRALLATHDYTKVVELCTDAAEASADDDSPYTDEHIYALYRSKDYRACLNFASSNSNNMKSSQSNLFRQHMRAQCHYRLKETQKSMSDYQDIISTIANEEPSEQEGSDMMEVWTNMCAVGLANDYLHFNENEKFDHSSDNIRSYLDLFSSSLSSSEEDYPYELAYNYGTWLALQGKSKDAITYLRSAHQHATNEEERMAIQFTLQQTSNNSSDVADFIENEDAYSKYPHLNWVVQQQLSALSTNNVNAVLLKPQDITLLHLTPSQIRKYWYNQCVLQLHTIYKNCNKKRIINTSDEDNDDLFYVMMDHLMLHIGNMKKKKNSSVSMVNSSHELYWMTKAAILNHLKNQLQSQTTNNQNGKKKKKSKKKSVNYPTLDEVEEKIKLEMKNNENESELLELAHIHVQLYKSQSSSSNEKKPSIPEMISTLESLPSRPAIQATLASLYQNNGQTDKVQTILSNLREQQQSPDHKNNNNMAQLYMQMSMFTNALDLLSNDDNDDNACQAMKVIALHELGQMDQAMDEWKSFKEQNSIMDHYTVDGEALEADMIPRLHKSSTPHPSAKSYDNNKEKEKKHREAVMKKRAKQREAYLEKHPELKNKTPDPERWLPKRDRVAKRRYNNKHLNAAQGITSQKDMNKLDAYARTTNPQSQSSQNQPSTRHMSVSATGKNRRAAR